MWWFGCIFRNDYASNSSLLWAFSCPYHPLRNSYGILTDQSLPLWDPGKNKNKSCSLQLFFRKLGLSHNWPVLSLYNLMLSLEVKKMVALHQEGTRFHPVYWLILFSAYSTRPWVILYSTGKVPSSLNPQRKQLWEGNSVSAPPKEHMRQVVLWLSYITYSTIFLDY